ncbi:hypothetical protein QAD02_016640 [Eretmocerus hayati]|uniref:Uncharacterized protein n=1 Tax=Eretmocerus hayati TaxID=131215 RepID=A0ACC2PCQ3_9HYME|nr:hypothetical protein QAD02_016640 [Eretmocerus hayati]
MELRSPDPSLNGALYAALLVLRVFGLAPYQIFYSPGRQILRLRRARLNHLYAFGWMAINFYVMFIYIPARLKSNHSLRGIVEMGTVVLNLIVTSLELLLSNGNRMIDLLEVLRFIVDFDNFVRENLIACRSSSIGEHWANYKTMLTGAKVWLWSFASIGLGVHLLTFTCFQRGYRVSLKDLVLVGAPFVITTMAVNKFCGIVFLLRQRFRYLSEYMHQNLKARNNRRYKFNDLQIFGNITTYLIILCQQTQPREEDVKNPDHVTMTNQTHPKNQ